LGPDGRFESSFAFKTGSSLYVFKQNESAGLDPFKLFLEKETEKPDRETIVEFVSSFLNEAREPELRTDLKLACDKSASFEELLQNSPQDLRRQLEADLKPYMFLFEGEPIQLDSRTCFVLSSLPDWAKDVAQFLAFTYSWRAISHLPEDTKKMVVVDEGWRLISPATSGRKSSAPSVASSYVPMIARTGRHYKCAFILATQLARDFFHDDTIGRTMIESCATKVVLKQDEAASELLSSQLALGNEEQRFLQRCSRGQGLLLTPEGKVQFYNFLSDDEKTSFAWMTKEMRS
jgi:type IV secretory pathway VirB4 component